MHTILVLVAVSSFAGDEYPELPRKITDETPEQREKYMPRFNPDLFDAKKWARVAKAAGMKYVVLTAKHHEGFCMWGTATTDYKIWLKQ